jgi:hypothetical protein
MQSFKFLESRERYNSLTAIVHFNKRGSITCASILWAYIKDCDYRSVNIQIREYKVIIFRGNMCDFFDLYDKLVDNNSYLWLPEIFSIESIGSSTYTNCTTRQMPIFNDQVEIKYRKYVKEI